MLGRRWRGASGRAARVGPAGESGDGGAGAENAEDNPLKQAVGHVKREPAESGEDGGDGASQATGLLQDNRPALARKREEEEDAAAEAAAMSALTAEELALPRWLRYAKVTPKRYWVRPHLGGDETPAGYLSFVLDVLHLRGTVLRRCILPAGLSAAITAAVVAGEVQLPAERAPDAFFLPYFLLTLFVVGFRLYGAWFSYRKGHEMVLQMGSSAVDLLLTCTTSIHVRNSGMDLLEMLRRLNILAAFIRQDLRESRHHLVDPSTFKAGAKKSRLATEWFNETEESFVKDRYGSPPLKLLLTPGEVQVYKSHGPQDRVIVCTIAIRTLFAKHVHVGAKRMSTPDSKLFQGHLERVIHSWAKCRELIRTPPPFVLHHLGLGLSLSVCVLFGPVFLSARVSGAWAIVASAMLTFGLYALEEAACEMEVPFGWRATDANLSKMCRTVLKRSWTFTKICKIGPARSSNASKMSPTNAQTANSS